MRQVEKERLLKKFFKQYPQFQAYANDISFARFNTEFEKQVLAKEDITTKTNNILIAQYSKEYKEYVLSLNNMQLKEFLKYGEIEKRREC